MSDTPETDAVEFTVPIAGRVVLSQFSKKLERERDEARNKMAEALGTVDLRTLDFERMKEQRDEAIAYADQLAAGLPEGMLPKDVELLREANHGLASELAAERALADRLADVFEFYCSEDGEIHIAGIKSRPKTTEALAAWKEARNE